ncbi:MAG: SdpI family protein [Slackia sp.]|nr:SdpI family protein [Slackia sp.]
MADSVAVLILIAVLVVAALFFFVLGRKMASGKLRPNSFVGIRVPSAFRSDGDWYSVQFACARYVVLLSFVLCDSALLFFVLGVIIADVPLAVPSVISAIQVAVAIVLLGRCAVKDEKRN